MKDTEKVWGAFLSYTSQRAIISPLAQSLFHCTPERCKCEKKGNFKWLKLPDLGIGQAGDTEGTPGSNFTDYSFSEYPLYSKAKQVGGTRREGTG